MNKYELMAILKSTLKEETRNKEIEKIKTFLEKEKASKVVVDAWGLKKFAYPIDYKTDGFYILVNFSSSAEVPNKLANLLKVNENFVRYMFVAK